MPRSRRVRRERTHDRQQIQPDTVPPVQQGGVASRLPLSALLSQVLVAFTIEFDNEFEHQMPHRTSKHGSSPDSPYAPWLVSLAMWSNCMRFVGEEGVTLGELQRLARTTTNLAGMQRWGYILVEPGPADSRSKQPRPDAIVRPIPAGCKAQKVWRPLFGIIEKRWQARYGKDEIDQLRESLWAVAKQFDVELPDCLPILGYGLFSRGPDYGQRAPAGREAGNGSRLPLPTLLSRVLLAFALEFENESEVSLAISANVVRLLDEQGVRARDLPRLAGVSKEAIAMSLSFLEKHGYAVGEPAPSGSRFKVVRLAPKGREAQDVYRQLVWAIEERWQARFGKDTIRTLRESLERLVGEPSAQLSPLFKGLEPYPDGWRASVRKPDTLPHYPMVLHRGGFPDGS
jgi:DNA-binding MarR family transcriptional regulator